MKLLDKFLKFLKTDRNTFFTYILTLLTAYFVVDRIVEMLLMIFTGVSTSYWGPIMYTLALACPVFAFLFSCSSKFAEYEHIKLSFFDLYVISLYILVLSMFMQFTNKAIWLFFLSVPNYPEIVGNFSYLIRPAFSSIALYLPLTTFMPLIKWLITKVHDTKNIKDSIYEYGGISLKKKDSQTGSYSCSIEICRNKDHGKIATIAEDKRFYQMLVCGVSGMGKTSLIFEPMIARDLDKKNFFSSIAKEMGFTALKTGLASISKPYSNEYLNKHFSLNMLKPDEDKMDTYNNYMKKMTLNKSNGKYVYRDLGLTFMTPDPESMERMMKVADSYGIGYNVVDPSNPNSVGLNPFVFDDPIHTSIAISTVLKGLYASSHPDMTLAYRENAAEQAVENISILLKEIYPRLNNDDLPTLEDVQSCLNDFDYVQALCEELRKDEELGKKYATLLRYFEKNFYRDSVGRKEMEKFVTAASSELDILLRFPGVKNVLCNRNNNINFDNALENGDITFVCTRRGDLGINMHQAFGLFFILLMQYSVLRRPGSEKTRIPHFLYIDEFANFIGKATEPLFTLYRKYRVGTIISVQNLKQLTDKYRDTILSNCSNKIVFGNNTPEDNAWWARELGSIREWRFKNDYETDKGKYSPKLAGISNSYDLEFKESKVQSLKFKQCFYKIAGTNGKPEIGIGNLDFLPASFTKPKETKKYDFAKFTGAESKLSEHDKVKKNKITHFDDMSTSGETDPIKTDTNDSKFLFDNEDAIVVNLKKGKKDTTEEA